MARDVGGGEGGNPQVMKTHSKQRRDKKKKKKYICWWIIHAWLEKSPSRRKKSKKWFFFLGRSFSPPQIEMAPLPLSPKFFSADFFFKKEDRFAPPVIAVFSWEEKNLGTREMAPNDFFFRSWRKDISLQGCVGLPPFKETGRRIFLKKIWGKPLWVTRVRYVHPPPLIIPSHERMWCRKRKRLFLTLLSFKKTKKKTLALTALPPCVFFGLPIFGQKCSTSSSPTPALFLFCSYRGEGGGFLGSEQAFWVWGARMGVAPSFFAPLCCSAIHSVQTGWPKNTVLFRQFGRFYPV